VFPRFWGNKTETWTSITNWLMYSISRVSSKYIVSRVSIVNSKYSE